MQDYSIQAEVLFQGKDVDLIEIKIKGNESVYLIVSPSTGVAYGGEIGNLQFAQNCFNSWARED